SVAPRLLGASNRTLRSTIGRKKLLETAFKRDTVALARRRAGAGSGRKKLRLAPAPTIFAHEREPAWQWDMPSRAQRINHSSGSSPLPFSPYRRFDCNGLTLSPVMP